jgi:hypothetical protein
MISTTTHRRTPRTVIWLILLGVLAVILFSLLPFSTFIEIGPKLNLFATIFLGIFIEALPYLLVGTFISGLVEVFIDRDQLTHLKALCPRYCDRCFNGAGVPRLRVWSDPSGAPIIS